jgi:hypothetical protein
MGSRGGVGETGTVLELLATGENALVRWWDTSIKGQHDLRHGHGTEMVSVGRMADVG